MKDKEKKYIFGYQWQVFQDDLVSLKKLILILSESMPSSSLISAADFWITLCSIYNFVQLLICIKPMGQCYIKATSVNKRSYIMIKGCHVARLSVLQLKSTIFKCPYKVKEVRQ